MGFLAAMVNCEAGGGGRGAGCLILGGRLVFVNGACVMILDATIGVSLLVTVPLMLLAGVTTVVTVRGTPVENLICCPDFIGCDVTVNPFCNGVMTFDWAKNISIFTH